MKNVLLACLLIFQSVVAFSCTTFVLKNENKLVFGRNLDWVSDDGVVVVNKRNVHKTSVVFPPEKPTSWTSKYGSVTFNQFGKEFPFGGMNEKGLVVEIMRLRGSYPAFDDRTAVNEVQWIQYQLDNCSTIEEVIKTDEFLRISRIDKNIHFLICDKYGNTAVIEFSREGMQAYTGKDLPHPVLANNRYPESLERLENRVSCRFTTAVNMVQSYKTDNQKPVIDYAFNILDKVAINTSWSIVYDVANMQIHFKMQSNKHIRVIDMNRFDYGCASNSLLYDLKLREKGNITENFVPFTEALNNKKLNEGIRTNQIRLPKGILNRFYSYNDLCTCEG